MICPSGDGPSRGEGGEGGREGGGGGVAGFGRVDGESLPPPSPSPQRECETVGLVQHTTQQHDTI